MAEPAVRKLWRACVAELLGTFFYVFGALGLLVSASWTGSGGGLWVVAFGTGAAAAVAVSATAHLSGGHLNPAVSLGAVFAGRLEARAGAGYVAAQTAGAIAAALFVGALMPTEAVSAAQLGAPALAPGVEVGKAFALEALAAALWVFAHTGTVSDHRAPQLGGLSVGLAVTLGVLVVGPLTGAALNPARALGPALVAGAWQHQWLYWLAPVVGALVVVGIYRTAFAEP